MPGPEIAVVVPTFNRGAMLAEALDSILAEECRVPWEFIVVDNNSTDSTSQLLSKYETQFPQRIRSASEKKPGAAYARNLGIASTTASILAFTDDDVRVEPGWLNVISETFAAHPEIAFVGGKILPRWPKPVPDWVSRSQDASFAILDAGEKPFVLDRQRPFFIASANLAVRRTVLEACGGFNGAVRFVEDNDLLLRMWQSGYIGIYVPEMIVHAEVQPERMEKKYHRQWARNNGTYCARMRLAELYDRNGALRGPEPPPLTRVFGAPLYCCRLLLQRLGTCLATPFWKKQESFAAEAEFRWMWHYIRESVRMWRADRNAGVLTEMRRLGAALSSRPGHTGKD